MAEMTPEERAVYISHFVEAKNLKNVPAKEAVKQQAIAQIRAAVAAEHERTKEACAKVAEEYAAQRKQGGLDTQRALAADYIAATIRAMPEQGAERGKEPQIKTPQPKPLPWRIGKVSFY